MDKARQLMDRLRRRLEKREYNDQDYVTRGENFKSLKEHPGWKSLTEWMQSQEDLIIRAMTEGVKPDREKGLDRLEVYDNLQRDYAIFQKIQKYIDRCIRLGEESRQKLALREQQRQKKENEQNKR